MDEALRITFEYKNDRIEVQSIRRIAMRVPLGESPRERRAKARIGQFVELRDARGEVLYRRHTSDLVPRSVEYPTGDAERPLARAAGPEHGTFSVLVPVHEQARTVAVVETSTKREPGDETLARAVAHTGDLVSVELESDHYGKRSS